MITINRLKLDIDALNDSTKTIEKCGFDIPFNTGLNIIAGENTSGKTSIMKCLYYALGLEQLLNGKKNAQAMSRPLKEVFQIKKGDDEINYLVNFSFVTIEIVNNNELYATIRRTIKGANLSEEATLTVWDCKMDDIDNNESSEYFVNSIGDHGSFGFYSWLAKFLEWELPTVDSYSGKNGESLLYMQLIMSIATVEQTKGWSDFFASNLGLSVIDPKQRVMEFVLKMVDNGNEAKVKALNKKKKQLELNWKEIFGRLRQVLTINNLHIKGVTMDNVPDKNTFSKVKVYLLQSDGVLLEDFYKEKTELYKKLQDVSLGRTKTNNSDVFNEIKIKKEALENHQKQYDEFKRRLLMDSQQQSDLQDELLHSTEELKRNTGLEHLSSNVMPHIITECPTCHQTVTNLSSKMDLNLDVSLIKNNIGQLKKSINIIEATLKTLKITISEKKIYEHYYQKALLKESEELQSLYNDMCVIDGNSEKLITEKIELRNLLQNLNLFKEQYFSITNEMISIIDAYAIVKEDLKTMKEKGEEDKTSLYPIQIKLQKLLSKFGYDSNKPYMVVLPETGGTNTKYLPSISDRDHGIQDLKVNSSASDIIRCIWAFNIALLCDASRHPGFLLMDEPCQHSVKSESLSAMFKECAALTDKQTILACSSEVKFDEDKEFSTLSTMLAGIDKYHIYNIPKGKKAIDIINNN